MNAFFLYSLFYVFMSGCIIYPPTAFVSAGLTITQIFSNWMGSENECFVQYHIKRSLATLFVHSVLPLGYFIGIISYGQFPKSLGGIENALLLVCLSCSILGPLYIFKKIVGWVASEWSTHPIAQNLVAYAIDNMPWTTIASDINTEYRRIDKVIVNCNNINHVIVTDNWIIKVIPYGLQVAHQNDTALIVHKSDIHEMPPTSRGDIQFINIQVKPTRPGVKPFEIRLNGVDFKDFSDKVSRPIVILQSVQFLKPLSERFIDAFKEHIAKNRYYNVDKDAELCIGCMQAPSNVKLMKLCNDVSTNGEFGECRNCNCRPMWCMDCIAKWFVSRQDENTPETWLSSKCTCPMCRATFCVLDVCLIQKTEH